MSKYQALIDALEAPGLSDCPWVAFGPSNDAAPPDYYNEVVAVRGDAQVQVICHAPRGLDGACTADTTYIAEANPATIRALLADLERAEKALNRIASWSEGEQVTPSFDEPNAASIARDYLSGVSDADGAQTSPIPCDVFSGGSLFKKGTPICDLAEHIDTEAARLVWAMANMGMSNDHSRNFTTHVLRVGGIGDIHDCRTYIDAALAQMAGG